MSTESVRKITGNTELIHLFKPHELHVILTEVFCLPFFLHPSQILTSNDIALYLDASKEAILFRLNGILSVKPEWRALTSKYIVDVEQMNLDDLLKNKPACEKLIESLLKSDSKVALHGRQLAQTFSAAMYLIEEGVKVNFYSADELSAH
jgi:hypothetical protein